MDKSMGNNEIQKGEILLQVKNLKKYYPVRTGFVKKTDLKAVDDVSFFVRKGETLGIVGESGCGKTTLGRTVLRLEEPTSGDIIYENESIIGKDMKEYRKKMQIVFQEPEMPKLPEDLNLLHVTQVGRIHTLIVRGSSDVIKSRLAAFQPILMEALPLTLEEIFIYELGGADYAVKDIVL